MTNTIKINSEDCARLRKSLLTVVQAAVLHEDTLMTGFPSGSQISDCLDIVDYLEEKGGEV